MVPPQAGSVLGVDSLGWIEELGPDEYRDFSTGADVYGLMYGGMPISPSR